MHLYPRSLQDLSPQVFSRTLPSRQGTVHHDFLPLQLLLRQHRQKAQKRWKALKSELLSIRMLHCKWCRKNSTNLSTAKGQGSKMLAARPQGFPWNLLRLGHAEPLRKLVTVAHLLSPPWTEAGPITTPIEAGLGVNELGSTLGWLKMPNLCLIVVSDLSTQVMSSSKIWWSTHLHTSLPTQVAAEGTSMITVFGSAIILRKRVATR